MNHLLVRARLFAALCGCVSVIAGCSGGTAINHDCNDGLDNDADGLTDDADPGCALNGVTEAPDPGRRQCSDGRDNDGDGAVDHPDDRGCATPDDDDEFDEPVPRCRDGVDNDEDGFIDFPNDPGCFTSLDNDEGDGCPDVLCPACFNGLDDDGDGLVDFPDDPGCDTATDDDEFDADTTSCGTYVTVEPLPADNAASGSAEAMSTNELISIECGGSGQESAYVVEVSEPRTLVITTDFPQTTLDTVVYVRGTCRDPDTELGCNDDSGSLASTLQVAVLPGTYFVIVDAHNAGSAGDYRLEVASYNAPGGECDPDNPDCPPGHVCRPLDDNTTIPTCELPSCQDGVDNDFDGLTDHPADPGCADLDDNDESDDCPTGPGCPQCGNGADDDADGQTDYPADPGCDAAGDDAEVDCDGESDVIDLVDAGQLSGSTLGLAHDFTPGCGFSPDAPDKVFQLSVPGPLTTLTIDTEGSGYDTIVSVKTPDCSAADLACNDDGGGGGGASRIQLDNVQPGPYLIVLDGFSSGAGPYVLSVHGVIPAGGGCDPAVIATGLFSCESGHVCDVDTCVLAQCANGVDDDADGLVDVAQDPGCASPSDDDEVDDCPAGPTCPACSNDADDDGDGLTDHPADPGCLHPGDDSEIDQCIPGVDVIPLPDSGATGTTPPPSAGSNFTPSCNFSADSTEDVYHYDLDRDLAEITFSTAGSTGDTVISVRQGDCDDAMAEIACFDVPGGGESVTLASPAQGDYYVFVDGNFVSQIDYLLEVGGIIALGDPCDPADTAFVCEPGAICDGGTALCVATQCNNGVNDDPVEDALVDFLDPGCASIDDDSESPNPSPVPDCGDGADNDGDGLSDYPADLGCALAADPDEVNCHDSEPIVEIVDAVTTGDTTAANDDHTPSCTSSSTAPERVYSLTVPGALTALTMNTFGSTYDTVLYVKRDVCANPDIACNDDSGGLQSSVSLTAAPAGVYYIFVDGYDMDAGPFTLEVTGEIATGQPCDEAQVMAGILACEGSTSCVDLGTGFLCQ